jgi:ABC-type nitrate/sulfonate/bicarbonate transport system ATPase subunit
MEQSPQAPGNGKNPKAKIVVREVHKTFYQKQKGVEVRAIADLNLDIHEGEYLVIVGETGAGKSVFFDCVLGLKDVTSGQILIDDIPAQQFRKNNVGKITRIFQEDRLLPWRTATENACLGLEIQGASREKQIEIAHKWLKLVGLWGFENSYPNELSGGMRQRVNIARAFATQPEILLLDEAFGGLDEVTATRLRKDFLDLAHQQKMTFLMVTHSIEEALILGSRILIFGVPAHVVHTIDVPHNIEHNESLFEEKKEEIMHWIAKEGRMKLAVGE